MADRKPRYQVVATLEADHSKTFATKGRADAYLEAVEARLAEANKLADGEIWTSIEIIYESRLDWMATRLAAAKQATSLTVKNKTEEG